MSLLNPIDVLRGSSKRRQVGLLFFESTHSFHCRSSTMTSFAVLALLATSALGAPTQESPSIKVPLPERKLYQRATGDVSQLKNAGQNRCEESS